jgi:hypothetical protein
MSLWEFPLGMPDQNPLNLGNSQRALLIIKKITGFRIYGISAILRCNRGVTSLITPQNRGYFPYPVLTLKYMIISVMLI